MKKTKLLISAFLFFIIHFSCQPGDSDPLSVLQTEKFMATNPDSAAQDAPRALSYYQKVVDASEGTKNYRALGRIYNQMGNLYAYQLIYDEALPMHRKSCYYYQLAGDSLNLPYAMRDMARVYNKKEQKDSALLCYQRAKEWAYKVGDKVLESSIGGELGRLYTAMGEYTLASQCLYLALKNPDAQEPYRNYLDLGNLYLKTDQLDSAYFYLNKSINKTDIYALSDAYKYLSLLEENRTNFKEAVKYNRLHWQWRDSVTKVTNTKATQRMVSLYNYQIAKKKSDELMMKNKKKQIFIYQLTLLLITVAIGSVVYLLREKNRRKDLEQKRQQQVKIKEQQYKKSLAYIEENKRKIKELENQLVVYKEAKNEGQAGLIQAQKEMLEITNQEIFSLRKEQAYRIKGFRQSDIYHTFHNPSNMDVNKITADDWLILQDELNKVYDNFIHRLYALCPQLSMIELQICCLLKISITVTNMAKLTGHSKSAITAVRVRLNNKLRGEEGTAKMLDAFITDL